MTFVEACGAAETELAEVTWQEKLSEVSADLLSQLPCYMAGGSFMTLSVDYQNLHLYTSSLIGRHRRPALSKVMFLI